MSEAPTCRAPWLFLSRGVAEATWRPCRCEAAGHTRTHLWPRPVLRALRGEADRGAAADPRAAQGSGPGVMCAVSSLCCPKQGQAVVTAVLRVVQGAQLCHQPGWEPCGAEPTQWGLSRLSCRGRAGPALLGSQPPISQDPCSILSSPTLSQHPTVQDTRSSEPGPGRCPGQWYLLGFHFLSWAAEYTGPGQSWHRTCPPTPQGCHMQPLLNTVHA